MTVRLIPAPPAHVTLIFGLYIDEPGNIYLRINKEELILVFHHTGAVGRLGEIFDWHAVSDLAALPSGVQVCLSND